MLVRIVAKGGNLLLGIGPDGKGEFNPAVYQRLEDIGRWLQVNGEAIYETVPVEPFQDGNLAYTKKNDSTFYVIYLPGSDRNQLPESLVVRTNLNGTLNATLPYFGKELKTKIVSEGLKVSLPGSLKELLAAEPAFVIKIENERSVTDKGK